MDHLQRLNRQVQNLLILTTLLSNLVLVTIWVAGRELFNISPMIMAIGLAFIAWPLFVALAWLAARFALRPFWLLRQAILHVSPGKSNEPAPDLDNIRVGKELIGELSAEVYNLAAKPLSQSADSVALDQANLVIGDAPIPLIALNKELVIVSASQETKKYLSQTEPVIGKNLYDVLDMSFSSEDNFEEWLKISREKSAIANKAWQHVRLSHAEGEKVKQFDLYAYFTRDSPSGIETVIALADHSDAYAMEDANIGFIAMAVHELRGPLTLLRGYIDVFQEELDGKLNPELANFMTKMQVAAEQQSAFVNNILNVARVEENQLTLELHESNWDEIIKSVISDLRLRAEINNQTIEYTPSATPLPTVAVDQVSIYETLSNLIDNAIKYGGSGKKKIIVSTSLTKDGFIETTVQDFGVGIPESSIPNLFAKFYRSHRTKNQTRVGGTGLGLYLAKAIVTAHGGQIWVQSKEGEGAKFGFTLQPYVMVAHKIKSDENVGVTREAHGWIKNHSFYKR